MYEEDETKNGKGELDLTKLKFVLYARKSTEDEGSQVNSIEDQITYCERYAKTHGLTIVGEPIREEHSAKYPNNRPKFRQMLKDIRTGTYDAIISYHPDRLARNMLEAGQILDMLTPDKHKNPALIKTLVFPTVNFVNDTANRLTLAVLFSLATNFSEHLSEMVQRTTDTNLKKGISVGTPKWGYDIDPITRHYVPNADFDLVRKGWDMLLAGKTQKEVVDFWEKEDLHRLTKITRKNKTQRKITISVKMTPTIFRDSFFCGVLCQKDDEKNLDELYKEGFQAMVTREEWNKVQAILPENAKKKRLIGGKAPRDFLPFRGGFLRCGECGKSMVMGISRGGGGDRYAYAMCQNPDCTRKNKNVRLSTILECLCNDLDKLKPTKAEYEEYSKKADDYASNVIIEARKERMHLIGKINQLSQRRDELSRQFGAVVGLGDGVPESTRQTLANDITKLNGQIKSLEVDKRAQEAIIKDPTTVKMAKKEFLSLMKNIGNIARAGDLVQKDQITRFLFLNMILTNENTLNYLCKTEFEGLLKTGKILNGARDWT